jgi:ABC-type sugar transport system substrate-binding protein
MKKGMVLIVAMLVLSLMVGACSKSESGQSGGGMPKVAFSIWTMEYDFFQLIAKGAQAAGKDAGVEIIIHDEKSDQTEQVSGCQNLLNQGIVALCVTPFAPGAMPAIVEEAHRMGIPVVICDIGTGGSNHDGFMYSDCFGGGRMNGELALKEFAKRGLTSKTYALLRSPPEAEVSQMRNNGAAEILDAAGFTCVANIHTTDTTEDGYSSMSDVLAANPNVSIVVCGNDAVAAGSGQACFDAGKRNVIITGFNADDEGVEALRNGTIASTIQQFPYDMGYTTVMFALDLVNKRPVTYDNPAKKEIYVDVKLVTVDDVPERLSDQPISIKGTTRAQIGM